MFICQVLCNGIQGIYALLMGGQWAKEGSSAKYEHTSKFTPASQRSVRITYERPISTLLKLRQELQATPHTFKKLAVLSWLSSFTSLHHETLYNTLHNQLVTTALIEDIKMSWKLSSYHSGQG